MAPPTTNPFFIILLSSIHYILLIGFAYLSPALSYWQCTNSPLYRCILITAALLALWFGVGITYVTRRLDTVSALGCEVAALVSTITFAATVERCIASLFKDMNTWWKYGMVVLCAAPTYVIFCGFVKNVATRAGTREADWLPMGMLWLFPKRIQEEFISWFKLDSDSPVPNTSAEQTQRNQGISPTIPYVKPVTSGYEQLPSHDSSAETLV